MVVLIRRRIDDPLREGAVSVLTPFVAFLLADVVHASGVLAVVVAGLVLSYAGPRVIRARSRVLAYAFWDLSTFLINGGVVRPARDADPPGGAGIHRHLADAGADHRGGGGRRPRGDPDDLGAPDSYAGTPSTAARRGRTVIGSDWRVRTVAGWAGFRGAVSLAAALAVPTTTSVRRAGPRTAT